MERNKIRLMNIDKIKKIPGLGDAEIVNLGSKPLECMYLEDDSSEFRSI